MADAPKANGEEKVSILGIGGHKVAKATGSKKRKTPGEIRIQKDIAELDGGDVAQIKFPNANDLTKFNVIVTPDTGFWKGATYHFTFTIPAMCRTSRRRSTATPKSSTRTLTLRATCASTSCGRTGSRSSTSTPSSTGLILPPSTKAEPRRPLEQGGGAALRTTSPCAVGMLLGRRPLLGAMTK